MKIISGDECKTVSMAPTPASCSTKIRDDNVGGGGGDLEPLRENANITQDGERYVSSCSRLISFTV